MEAHRITLGSCLYTFCAICFFILNPLMPNIPKVINSFIKCENRFENSSMVQLNDIWQASR